MRWNLFTFLLIAAVIRSSRSALPKGESCRIREFVQFLKEIFQLVNARRVTASAVKRASVNTFGPTRLTAQRRGKSAATTITITLI